MRLRRVSAAFDDPNYIFELKHDGFRAIAYIENGECRLVSRNLKNLRFHSLKTALAKLPVRNAIIDGEIVCLNERGVIRNDKCERWLAAYRQLNAESKLIPYLMRSRN